MRTFSVTIKGVEPGLLMHKFADQTGTDIQNPVKARTKERPTAEEDARMSAYLLSTGELYQPAEHIYQCMVKAASEFQIQGRGKKTYKDLVKGGVIVTPECIPHLDGDYEIDSRPVVIQRARVMRHRPLLKDWELTFDIAVIDDGIPMEVLNKILQRAGEQIGIGDYRPRFGRFIVTKFE